MIRRALLTSLFAVFIPGALQAATSLEQAQSRLKAAIDEVLGLAVNAPSKSSLLNSIEPVLKKHVSFDVMTRRAIGPGWRQFSSEQQKRAITAFTRLITRTYGNKFTIGERPEITYHSAVSPAPGRVDVKTTTTYQGSRYTVVYRMEQADNWRTTDVVIEGVSMVANYRSQLDPVYRRGGPAAVIASLEKSANK